MSFFEFSMLQSRKHGLDLRNGGLDAKTSAEFEAASKASHEEQKAVEDADTISFNQFLDDWNSQ